MAPHEELQEELQFLRHYRAFMKDLFLGAGTDEDYWACEAYNEKKEAGATFDVSTFDQFGKPCGEE
jgi:hypothetical protein